MSNDLNKSKESPRIALKFANIIFILGILFSVLIIIYGIYKIYNIPEGKYINRASITPMFYLIGIIFGLISTTLFSFGLRLNNNLKINLSITVVAVVFAVYALETYLDIKSRGPFGSQSGNTLEEMRVIKAKQMGIEFDTRTRLEVFQDLFKEGIDAYPAVHTRYVLKKTNGKGLNINDGNLVPLGGISNKVTLIDNENGFWVKYKSDKFGFHNPENVYQNNEIDIVIIGDSFVEGKAVKSNENISGVLRELGFSVVNIGKVGNGPLLEFASLIEYAEPLKPKIVLWAYYESDLVELFFEMKYPLLKNYLNNDEFSQNLRSRQDEVDKAMINFMQKEWKTKMYQKVNPYKSQIFEKTEKNWIAKIFHALLLRNLRSTIKVEPRLSRLHEQELTIFKNILQKSRDRVSGWDGKLYFVYLPRFPCYNKLGTNCRNTFNKEEMYRKDVLQIIEKLNIPNIDTLNEVFKPHSDPTSLFPFRMYGHYNAKGYRLIAEAISNRLVLDGIKPF
tara:strand:- start:122 stop:1639 length:1518 start_codon:yes stop_codon:yes gene_type:complete